MLIRKFIAGRCEHIRIGDVEIHVLKVGDNRVSIGIQAPDDRKIDTSGLTNPKPVEE